MEITNNMKEVRASTCAIAYIKSNMEKLHLSEGYEDILKHLDVFATGFLIAQNIVITNRHVTEKIDELIKEPSISIDHIILWFVNTSTEQQATSHFIRIIDSATFIDKDDTGRLDIGFLRIPDEGASLLYNIDIHPVRLGKLDDVCLGKEVAMWGYPYGSDMLSSNLGISRFGPAISRGMISAIAPNDCVDPRAITTFLIDINAAEGTSGSPIFTLDNGEVIGIHYAASSGVLGVGIPIDKARIDGWKKLYQENPEVSKVKLVGGGDVVINDD